MKIIGICGSSGSGKSTVSDYFRKCGFPVLDCDEIYHALVEAPSPCLDEIGENFGEDLIQNGCLDRVKLGGLVFRDPDKLQLLNEISHRHVIMELEKKISVFTEQDLPACFIDAPMLFEAGLDQRCDAVIAVVCDECKQIERICARDGIDEVRARNRIANQKKPDELVALADYVIKNNGTNSELIQQCEWLKKMIFTEKGE
ncbi:MAG: dephospho-CoA kinase [Clostridia bacterium]|nr:dephospho-CoA kinase [Clostridia bacterium]